MNIFMKALIAQTNKFQLHCELVFVDWNPPSDRQLLHEVLIKPAEDDFLTCKYIIVPNSLHKTLAFNEILPLYQMIAKNVGIRRATADFILCTNIDLIFSDPLMAKLKNTDLKEDIFYRANRCDVPSDIDENLSVEKLIEFCETNVLKINGLDPTKRYNPNQYSESFIFRYRIFSGGAKYYQNQFFKRPIHPYHQIKMLDLDACGDFTMMHKNSWERINGYYELEMYSLHIDSIAIIAAYSIGLKQETFPVKECTYHISHSGGWEDFDPINKLRFYSKRPVLDWLSIAELGEEMIKSKKAITSNSENWGLKDKDLTCFEYL